MSGGTSNRPTQAEVDEMTPEQLAQLASELDDVVVHRNAPRFPVEGTRAEKRAERAVAKWFLLSALFALIFVVGFIAWPFQYKAPGQPGHLMYSLYTPVIGTSFGLALLTIGVGLITYVKRFFPDELSVQQRHDGRSDDIDRRTVMAQLASAGKSTGFGRRKMIMRSLGLAGGIFGLGVGVVALGGLIRNPWKGGAEAALWVTPWKSEHGETVYLRRDVSLPAEEILKNKIEVRVRPEDLDAASIETVFPFRLSDLESAEKLDEPLHASDAPVMLIRLRPGTKVTQRAGRENFHYGDYYAYSKVCTHLGCPTSLFEAQTNRILCPCHQSQFLATEYAKPVFGPATRALPQLPISVDKEGYFVATGDFDEAVGPGFWERRSS
ncbi:ubiquinol-cytochrome c reductase iron-sulfur subunit [Pseudonocardia spinosispora]|uniref:cytochrome bc1 complex Rieske iron-sulfur subunit n=1 Tax=Pseudonocardia spinosispora TaxID=103441 RepID=UPI000406CF3F|nr:Rieske 2Fe-2S domain-containing protein [Pseudonocardia spinosispora]